jgi:hypothetical protein
MALQLVVMKAWRSVHLLVDWLDWLKADRLAQRSVEEWVGQREHMTVLVKVDWWVHWLVEKKVEVSVKKMEYKMARKKVLLWVYWKVLRDKLWVDHLVRWKGNLWVESMDMHLGMMKG